MGHTLPLTVAEDCAGLFTASHILHATARIRLVFGSELDDRLRAAATQIFSLPDDVVVPSIHCRGQPLASPHLYVAGWPCVKDSMQGSRSFENKEMWAVIKTIACTAPLTFILEHVTGVFLGERRRKRFKRVLSILAKTHLLRWKVLSPHTCAGIPQVRNRMFIIGVRRATSAASAFSRDWTWPSTGGLGQPISSLLKLLDRPDFQFEPPRMSSSVVARNLGHLRAHPKLLGDQPCCIVDFGPSEGREQATFDYCPTLTRARSIGRAFGLIKNDQFLVVRNGNVPNVHRLDHVDMAKIQGFPKAVVDTVLSSGISPAALRSALGNAINYGVLTLLIQRVLRIVRS